MGGRLRALAELVRAPAALSVPGDVIAGAAASGVPVRKAAGLAAASVLLYWAGMAANDWADRELDATERPERPIPSGRVPASAALGVAVGLTAAGLGVAGRAGGGRALAVAVPLTAAIWAYDLKLKNTAAGPAGMAACRALDVLLGASSQSPVRALPAAATIGLHTYTVTALSRHEVHGALDRKVPAATLAATAGVVGVASAGAPEWLARRVGPMLAATYATGYGARQIRLLSDSSPGAVRAAVGAGITEFPTLQGALTATAGRPLTGVAVALAAPLARMLTRKVAAT
ncbi:SCO3242 family prenyltransferase [Symbioplanes lichenis]|uniref:SCO3242 family prenyltransferase n=1 Tax=Symbioplanes lichenis TaxID=1629072 RepID=UPI0027388D13|nr:UbiA family prenyltransferase [Actinoplanes lichenis]